MSRVAQIWSFLRHNSKPSPPSATFVTTKFVTFWGTSCSSSLESTSPLVLATIRARARQRRLVARGFTIRLERDEHQQELRCVEDKIFSSSNYALVQITWLLVTGLRSDPDFHRVVRIHYNLVTSQRAGRESSILPRSSLLAKAKNLYN